VTKLLRLDPLAPRSRLNFLDETNFTRDKIAPRFVRSYEQGAGSREQEARSKFSSQLPAPSSLLLPPRFTLPKALAQIQQLFLAALDFTTEDAVGMNGMADGETRPTLQGLI
jgi:hypothetical protein